MSICKQQVQVREALCDAVRREFKENRKRIQDEENESSLNDRIDALRKFAPRFGIAKDELETAIAAVEERIAEIEEQSSRSSAPQLHPPMAQSEKFDDVALRNLFIPLLVSQ